MDAARRGRRHRDDLVAAVAAAHRPADRGPVGGQIRLRHRAAGLAHRAGDPPGDRAGVERIRAALGDGAQGAGEVRLHEGVAPRQGGVAAEEDRPGRGPAPEQAGRARQGIGEPSGDRDAGAGEGFGRRDQVGQRQLARSVEAVGLRQPPHRAGDADGLAGAPRGVPVRLAAGRQEHAGGRGRRRGLAIIDRHGLVPVGQMHEHEAAAAEVARLRQSHGQREADGDRGVDRVAAAFQDLDTDPRRLRLLARDHAVLGQHRQHPRIVGGDRRRGDRLREDRPAQCEQEGKGGARYDRQGRLRLRAPVPAKRRPRKAPCRSPLLVNALLRPTRRGAARRSGASLRRRP